MPSAAINQQITTTDRVRFYENAVVDGDCWRWTGPTIRGAYARFRVDGKEVPAARWAYEQFISPISARYVRQRCGNSLCVKPAHLFEADGWSHVDTHTRTCVGCGEPKLLDEFGYNAKRGYCYSRCKPCQADTNRVRYYGITVEQYDEMLDRQGGVCAICRCEETATSKGTIRALSVDHDHQTGAVRGLLCAACNVGLGFFADDPVRLEQAATYVRHGDN